MTKVQFSEDCQGEPVEPGFLELTRLRQAQADSLRVWKSEL